MITNKGKQRRQHILNTAILMHRRDNGRGHSAEEIAREAGVSRTSINVYFGNLHILREEVREELACSGKP